MIIDNSSRLFFASDVVLQVIDGEALVLKLQDETVFSLNDTGTRIAQLIDGGHPLDDVARILSDEYGLPRDEVEMEVKNLVQVLRQKGLVVERIA
jgi:Coenzyme PQQ synthesis protein D (PqqD)